MRSERALAARLRYHAFPSLLTLKPLTARTLGFALKAEGCHSERRFCAKNLSSAFYFKSGGILRFAQNDDENKMFAIIATNVCRSWLQPRQKAVGAQRLPFAALFPLAFASSCDGTSRRAARSSPVREGASSRTRKYPL